MNAFAAFIIKTGRRDSLRILLAGIFSAIAIKTMKKKDANNPLYAALKENSLEHDFSRSLLAFLQNQALLTSVASNRKSPQRSSSKPQNTRV
jgi:hypothetical protein